MFSSHMGLIFPLISNFPSNLAGRALTFDFEELSLNQVTEILKILILKISKS